MNVLRQITDFFKSLSNLYSDDKTITYMFVVPSIVLTFLSSNKAKSQYNNVKQMYNQFVVTPSTQLFRACESIWKITCQVRKGELKPWTAFQSIVSSPIWSFLFFFPISTNDTVAELPYEDKYLQIFNDAVNTTENPNEEIDMSSSILMDTTPNGTVVMLYDRPSHSFHYYATRCVQTKYLHSAALNYMLKFHRTWIIDAKPTVSIDKLTRPLPKTHGVWGTTNKVSDLYNPTDDDEVETEHEHEDEHEPESTLPHTPPSIGSMIKHTHDDFEDSPQPSKPRKGGLVSKSGVGAKLKARVSEKVTFTDPEAIRDASSEHEKKVHEVDNKHELDPLCVLRNNLFSKLTHIRFFKKGCIADAPLLQTQKYTIASTTATRIPPCSGDIQLSDVSDVGYAEYKKFVKQIPKPVLQRQTCAPAM